MTKHLLICSAIGKVRTTKGLVSVKDHEEELTASGSSISEYTGFVALNPIHHNCHLICPDQKCQKTKQTPKGGETNCPS